MKIIQPFSITRTFWYDWVKHCMAISWQSNWRLQLRRLLAFMSGSISKISVSFWKWKYILHGEFNHSYDLAYKACKISNKSRYLKRQGRVKKALKKLWRCDRYNLGTARRVWALGLGGVFSQSSLGSSQTDHLGQVA